MRSPFFWRFTYDSIFLTDTYRDFWIFECEAEKTEGVRKRGEKRERGYEDKNKSEVEISKE